MQFEVVQHIGPDPAGFCPAKTGREHGDRGVIGVNPLAAHHVPAQGIDQRAEQTRRLAHRRGPLTRCASGDYNNLSGEEDELS